MISVSNRILCVEFKKKELHIRLIPFKVDILVELLLGFNLTYHTCPESTACLQKVGLKFEIGWRSNLGFSQSLSVERSYLVPALPFRVLSLPNKTDLVLMALTLLHLVMYLL